MNKLKLLLSLSLLTAIFISCDKDDDPTPDTQQGNQQSEKKVNKQPKVKIKNLEYNQVFHFNEQITADLDIEDDSACVAINFNLYPRTVEAHQYKENNELKWSYKWRPGNKSVEIEDTKSATIKDLLVHTIPDKIHYGYYGLEVQVVDCNSAHQKEVASIKILPPTYEDTVKCKLFTHTESIYFSSVQVNTTKKRSNTVYWSNKYFLDNELKDITIIGPDALQFTCNKEQLNIRERSKETIVIEFHSLQTSDENEDDRVYLAQAELHAKDKDDNEYKIVLYGTNDY